MRKIIIMFAIVLALFLSSLFVSCGKVPVGKVDYAKQCIDSLKNAGAENSTKFLALEDTMNSIHERIEIQNTKLFKKFIGINNSLDYVIKESQRFVITNDVRVKKAMIQNESISIRTNPNVVKLEVEVTFDREQDGLEIASRVDEAVRHSMNLNAKLISVKIIE